MKNQKLPGKEKQLSNVEIPSEGDSKFHIGKKEQRSNFDIDTTKVRLCFQVSSEKSQKLILFTLFIIRFLVIRYCNRHAFFIQAILYFKDYETTALDPICSDVIICNGAHPLLGIDDSYPIIATEEGNL